MALFSREEVLDRSRRRVLNEGVQKSILRNDLAVESVMRTFSVTAASRTDFDIFLSHSYDDKEEIIGLYEILEVDYGYKVYVDWIVDPQLDRDNVTRKTAEKVRERMRHSRCLFHATSSATADSSWMPWETGFMDGLRNRVAICPYLDRPDTDSYYGQEFLGIYPYVTIGTMTGETKKRLWIHTEAGTYVNFDSWLNSAEPTKR